MLPNLIVIGAMKSGTTSLHEYLNQHPDIFMSKRKELNFFVEHQEWSKGLGWYESHFPRAAAVRGESSPNYTRYPLFPGVPRRMRDVIPDAKLVYCVRDPLKRFLSHYLHSYSLGRENRSLDEVVADLESPYLLCSRYYLQLRQYLEVYPAASIKVVVLEELQRNPSAAMRDLFSFLGVDPSYTDPRFATASKKMPPVATRRRSPLKSLMVRRKQRGVYWLERNVPWLFGPPLRSPAFSPHSKRVLIDALADDTEELKRFTGYTLASWPAGASADAASFGPTVQAGV